jgi:UDP-N-acetyl-2-amino-2-deoxyglucuronate dehydrogenase
MAFEPVKFGLVGCGGIGNHHAKVIAQLDCADLVAAADIIPERAEAISAKHGCKAFPSIEAMLDGSPDVEAVSICTPSGLHADLGIVAAQAGKHVLSEKPLDVVLEKIDRLIRTCDRKGVKLGCIFQHRWDEPMRRVKQAAEEGKFGDLVFGNADVKWYRAQSYYDSGEWRGTWALDGGCLANQAIHYIDEIIWLMGDVAEVPYARIATRDREMEAESVGMAVLLFANGAWGTIQASTVTWPGLATRIEVCGTKGAAVVSGDSLVMFKVEGEEESGVEQAPAASAASADPAIGALTGHDAQIADFAGAIRENREPLVTGREGRRSVAVLTEIYRKALGSVPLGRPAR